MGLPVASQGDEVPLGTLAERINQEHAHAEAAFRAGVEHAIAAGRLLLEAKAQVAHGGWLAWVRDNCRFGERTARGYMQIARYVEGLDGPDRQRVADLPYRDVLALVAQPREERDAAGVSTEVSPEVSELLSELGRAVEEQAANLLTMGRSFLEVKARLDPEQFAAWLAAEFPGDEDFLSATGRAVEMGITRPGQVIEMVYETVWGDLGD